MQFENFVLDTDSKKASYAIGQQIGHSLLSQGLKVDAGALAASIEDLMNGKECRLSEAEMISAIQKIQDEQNDFQDKQARENIELGARYMAENKKRPQVKTTASGLQYEVLTEGSGTSPHSTSTVQVHYRGTFLDGQEFDSSYKRNQPAEFPLNRVIRGWTEGLQLMNPGSKYRFVVPSELAYGEGGNQGIPGNSTLIFDVELLSVNSSILT